ncbi:hypothetical protein GCM10010260_54470 [Streptomyces filipinensis]|uniref:Uncharacterized protein n=1 Tax=Streptomyces filipinensis TaxID=66887 RepID=A0A918IEY7_9ACTN|nr:hypothetical protein [Streptomyces filipinensis]GGV09290.1 hypothetical protein GCM10010260_54470 [Streptomyces filipinensis]
MPMRVPCGTRLGSGRPTAASEHAGSPTAPAAAMRCAAATAAGEVYQVVVGGPAPWAVGVEVGVGDGLEVGGRDCVGVGDVGGREGGAGGGAAVDRAGAGVACGGRGVGVRTAGGGAVVRRWVGRLVGATGCGGVAVGVGVGLGTAVPVCFGAGLDVSGAGVLEGSGRDVGGVRVPEADGCGRGVPPSGIASHMPRPPRMSTAAPAAIHGALLGGRR